MNALFLYSHGFPDPDAHTTADRLAFHQIEALAARGPVDLLALLPWAKRGHPIPPRIRAVCRRVHAFPTPPSLPSALGAVLRGFASRTPPMLSLKHSGPAAVFLQNALDQRHYHLLMANSPLALADLPEPLFTSLKDGGAAPRLVLATEEVLWRAWKGYSWKNRRHLGLNILLHSRFHSWMARHERRLGRLADLVLCLSAREAESMLLLDPAIRTARIPLFVETAVFCPDDSLSAEPEILFTGFFGHPPNREAAVELAHKVLPRVRAEIPQARLHLAGRDALSMRGLADGPHIRLSESVPSLIPLYRRAAAVAGPIRTGEGVRGKFLEALACGCPVVTTPLGASGIEATPAEGLFTADSPADTAAVLVSLLRDPARQAALRSAAAAAMRGRHSVEAWRRAWNQAMSP